ncbi:single-stranded-DNA-specific exonuclease RecJ [Bacillus sp. 2205SS5-2]|uniref:single-stranded-DNA-specific exonuclease RecJ n=1 Tax=Bacillus sp. 2205SS5-2 TaxID=3109031 RepID=UPI003006DD8D
MLSSKSRWIVQNVDEEKINRLKSELNIPTIVAKLLCNRGIDTIDDARSFLWSKEECFHDPFLLKDMDVAVERIRRAISDQEKILIFGDYDADGVSSTSVMMLTLRDLGASVDFYIPNRFSEGYGPNEGAFRFAFQEGYSLIITVDTGIAAINEAELAAELGVDLIITDHHEPGPVLPKALAILHPKREDGSYPFPDLAGVGVAFKLAHGLYGEVPHHLLEIAAIGTIADLVPLFDENRAIVKKGLALLRQSKRPGIKALCQVAGTDMADIDEETVGFLLSPRINAVGRLADADPAVDLLLTENSDEALIIAKEIDSMNKERQAIVSEMTKEAEAMVHSSFPIKDNAVLVIGKEGWNPGVVGIVASRLVEKFYRPTIVLSFDPEKGQAKGSARSIAGFDLFKNLSEMRELLPHFGGHPMAAGMTLTLTDVEELRERLNKQAFAQLTAEDFTPVTELDSQIEVEDITVESIQNVKLLSPFGMGNPKPKMLISNASVGNLRKIGGNGAHLKLNLLQNGSSLDGIGFHMGNLADHIAPAASVSVIGQLSINEWNNTRKPQIFLQDVKVNEWQLFDMRGTKLGKWLHAVPSQDVLYVCFQEATLLQPDMIPLKNQVKLLSSLEEVQEVSVSQQTLVLLDLPIVKEHLETLLQTGQPARIYCCFFQADSHFFSTMPTREHFKWYYAFLSKKGQFDLGKYGDQLAKHRGWSKETVDFMSKVFFELDFVTINNGLISLQPVSKKKDFSESPSFLQKQAYFQLENELLYSPYQDLKSWFDKRVSPAKHEEEME